MRPLIIDSFAGGGGASTGIEMALGRSPDYAINHNADALAMHAVNHPATVHLDSNIWDVSPKSVCQGRPVGLLWASPDCKHFSKAKGGKPLDRNIRDLAWVVVRWAEEVKPDVILLENVEEFRTWGPIYEDGTAIAQLRGQTFDDWTRRLKKLGYRVQHRELCACDFGAPTIRKRLFLVARRDGRPIVWPARTHGDPKKAADARLIRAGRLKPWRTAAEIIDWSLPCPSIFDTSAEIMAKHGLRAVRPLADATMRRIARGVMRYVIEAKRPFIVGLAHGNGEGGLRREYDVDAPVTTMHAGGGNHAVVVPSFVGCGGRAGQSAPRGGDEPLGTITAKPDGCLVVAPLDRVISPEIGGGGGAVPFLATLNHGGGRDHAPKPVDEPFRTVTAARDAHALAAVHLSRFTQNGVGHGADEPLDTVMAGAPKFGVVAAFLAQHNNDSRRDGGVNPGRPADEPLATVTATGSQQSLVTAHLNWAYTSNTRGGEGDLEKPAKTFLAGGNHAALIAGFLTKYYGQGDGAPVDGPLHTDTTKDRFGLVTVEIDGATYAIADIGMRMLTPRERFRAQGFPDSYVIDRRLDGSPITATVQGSCCGNSVCPPLAHALAAANCGHLVEFREAAE